ncbi:MAG: thymidylate synthase [Archaeoglobaceae archaeon]|nr:thymidylate synthase [Archaeoglobaceae archaeon]
MFQSELGLVIFHYGFFGERFIANLMNYSNSCPSYGACGINSCTLCKEKLYSFSRNIVASFSMVDPKTLPSFVENAEDFLPRFLPEADVAIAINLHADILSALPEKLAGKVSALLVPVEEPKWCTPGLARQLKEKCESLGIEFLAPKPFCAMRKSGQSVLDKFIEEFGLGYPEFEIDIDNGRGKVRILRSQPCGCAWFIGVKLRGFDFSDYEMRGLWNTVSEAHHSYPCTASMEKDIEYGETLLHVAGYIARHAVDRALRYTGDEEIPEKIKSLIV